MRHSTSGFTLIELSIVLVIIGLIVGGVLAGQSLIRAAEVRAQISQIEKYNTAANTFYGKYGYLPGDITNSAATQFGFASRGQYAGEGDGNGLLEGVSSNSTNQNGGTKNATGENVMFWVDLSTAHLIDGGFTTASPFTMPTVVQIQSTTTPNIGAFIPEAKMGRGNYVYTYSGGWLEATTGSPPGDSRNYFGLSVVTTIYNAGGLISSPGLTVQQAYSIDTKVDDGLPQAGRVTAISLVGGATWLGDSDGTTGGPVVAGDGVATTPSATTCYDNAGSGGATEKYSLSQSGGANVNCALSFRFQ